MKYYREKSIAARIVQADESIANVQLNPDLGEALALQGYTETALAAGRELVDAVQAADTLLREQLGAQVVSTNTADKAYRSLRLAFDADRRQFRAALLEEPDYVDALRLTVNTSSSRGGFVLQARHFYEKVKADTEVMALVQGRINITPEYLDARIQQIDDLDEAFRIQRYLIGQSREARQLRQEAMRALDAWMKRFIAVARIAFSDDRPKLSKLNITVRSARPKTDEGVNEGSEEATGEPNPEAAAVPEDTSSA